MSEKYPWEGETAHSVVLKLTAEEFCEVKNLLRARGERSFAKCYRMLHHKAMGRLKGNSDEAK